MFERVSRIEITERTEKDPFAARELHDHTRIGREIVALFGASPVSDEDPTEAELLSALAGVPGIDLKNLEANLWRYSYGAVLDRRWRSQGVHEGQINAPWDGQTGIRVFPRGRDGAAVYYNSFGKLTFAGSFVMESLRNTFEGLRTECLRRTAFPFELG
jgi:hypothetical protein